MTLYSKLIATYAALIMAVLFIAIESSANDMGLIPWACLALVAVMLAESFRLLRCIERGEA